LVRIVIEGLKLVKYKVIVDRQTCIACGVAPSLCPEVFVLGEDTGRNRVTQKYATETTEDISAGVIPEELYECVKQAADACPVGAIKIEELKE
jgi:ferredoxin